LLPDPLLSAPRRGFKPSRGAAPEPLPMARAMGSQAAKSQRALEGRREPTTATDLHSFRPTPDPYTLKPGPRRGHKPSRGAAPEPLPMARAMGSLRVKRSTSPGGRRHRPPIPTTR
jgi:hypothetical protein